MRFDVQGVLPEVLNVQNQLISILPHRRQAKYYASTYLLRTTRSSRSGCRPSHPLHREGCRCGFRRHFQTSRRPEL